MLDWREEGQLSIGQEARGVQGAVDRGLRDEQGGSSDNCENWDNKFGSRHDVARLRITSYNRRGRRAQNSANMDEGDIRYPRTKDQYWKDQA